MAKKEPNILDEVFGEDHELEAVLKQIKKQYGKQLATIRESYKLTQGDFEKYINYQRNNSFKGTIDSDMVQKLAASAWRATSSCLFGKGKKVNDCTPEQAPQIDLIIFDLKRL